MKTTEKIKDFLEDICPEEWGFDFLTTTPVFVNGTPSQISQCFFTSSKIVCCSSSIFMIAVR